MEDKFENDIKFEHVKRMYQLLNSKIGIKRVYAVEAFH